MAEHPGILPPGLHICSLEILKQLCVEAMPSSKSRPLLLAALSDLIGGLAKEAISCEVWVGGSFLSGKLEPNDVDAVVFISALSYNLGTPEFRQKVDALIQEAIQSNIDCHIEFVFDPSDPMYAVTEADRRFWLELLSFDRARRWHRGIAVVKV